MADRVEGVTEGRRVGHRVAEVEHVAALAPEEDSLLEQPPDCSEDGRFREAIPWRGIGAVGTLDGGDDKSLEELGKREGVEGSGGVVALGDARAEAARGLAAALDHRLHRCLRVLGGLALARLVALCLLHVVALLVDLFEDARRVACGEGLALAVGDDAGLLEACLPVKVKHLPRGATGEPGEAAGM